MKIILSVIILSVISSFIFPQIKCENEKPAGSSKFNSASIELNNKALSLWQKEMVKEKPDFRVAVLVISLLDSAITADSSYYLAYGNKANILLGYGRTLDAIETMEKCIKNSPEMAESIALLGMLYEGNKNKKEAIKNYEKALAVYRMRFKEKHDFTDYSNGIIILLQLGKKKEADSLVSKLPGEFPDRNKEIADFLNLYKTYNHKETIKDLCRKRYIQEN
ncbi:MAG: tetratricopeptide repeat protein [Ignavibacteria bacterium]|jgi:tetratricopeptide (TPR) repeat protein|nr:tetratricopeptide repeat protein [Ignavibacteria bacterium]MCU7522039.1 tetratricopeptide repeat protein [Ignavibacteria bacterium]MCU7524920.1 tetratricopeptide repeat protein [Ignavibacteria bacterium]